jgi:nucleoside-diphosphate-sugar epimerase
MLLFGALSIRSSDCISGAMFPQAVRRARRGRADSIGTNATARTRFGGRKTMTSLLITGASGFVGGSLVSRARESGRFTVTGVGRRPLEDRGYIACDLARGLDIAVRPDVVVHAAARSSPWGSRREYFRQNVDATREVLRFCERSGRPRLVFVSTGAVFYKRGHQTGLHEDSPIGPDFINTYAETKRAAELLVREYAGEWVILRPRAVFGPGDTVIFPRIVKAVRSGRLPHFTTNGPPALADMIYIDSLSDYIFRAATDRSVAGEINVTNNEPVPIMDFLCGVLDRLGLPRPDRVVPAGRAMRAAGVVESVYRLLPFLGEPPVTRFGVSVFAWSKTFDVSRCLATLGPASVSLSEGVDRFVEWQAPRLRSH